MTQPVKRRKLVRLLLIAFLAVMYFVTGKFGLMLAFVNASASAVWPPSGIALAALLMLGWEVWPGIFLGAFLVNATTAGSLFTSFGVACGNTLEGLAAAYLVHRFANGLRAFERARDVFKLTALAAFLSTAISATIGVTSLAVGGFVPWAQYSLVWLTWWFGDAGGILIVTPLLILWSMPRRWPSTQIFEGLFVYISLLLLGQLVFGGLFPILSSTYPLGIMCLLPLIWVAFRFGQRETAAAIGILALLAIRGTLRHLGPFAGSSQNESLLLLQAFLDVTAVTTMALAAVVSERKEVEASLREARDQLERRVEERTTSLKKSVGELLSEVAERRRAETALQHSEARYQAIVDSVVDYAIIGLDAGGRIQTWNRGAERINGYKADEILGKHFSVFYVEQERARGLPQILLDQARREGHVEHTGWRVRKDGSLFWGNVIMTALRDETGSIRGFAKVTRDVTERKRAEEERDRIFNLPLDLLCVAGFDGYFRQLNPQWERMFGFTTQELCSKPYLDFAHPDDRQATRRHMEALAAGQEAATFENRYLCRDGSFKWLLWNAVSLPERQLIYAAARDITDRIEAEQLLKRAHGELQASHEQLKAAHLQLIQAAKLESVGRLAAGVAHEVKNPLAIILQGVDFLSKRVAATDRQTAIVIKHTTDAVRRADSIVRGLLDFSTTRELKMNDEDLNAVVEQALLLVKHELDRSQVKTVKMLQSRLPRVPLDQNKFEQVLVNIFMNAVHAMPKGGTLTVRTFTKRLGKVDEAFEVGERTQDRFRIGQTVIVTEVEDTGAGIPEESMQKIFDPFFTTKPTGKGTGLGLTVVKKIVELHDGLISVKNRKEGGVRVTLFLKMQPGAGNSHAASPPADTQPWDLASPSTVAKSARA